MNFLSLIYTIYHSFENGYECSFNINKKDNSIINFKSSFNNSNKLLLDDVKTYPENSNLSNYHTHPNNSNNLLSYFPSSIDIITLINAAYYYKSSVKDTIISSIKENNKTVVKKLEYFIDNLNNIDDIYNDKEIIADIFNTLAHEYTNNHNNLDKYIEDYENSGLKDIIKINIY